MKTDITLADATTLVRSWNWPEMQARQKLDYLWDLSKKAALLPEGHLVRIVWDAEEGYPEHAWGYEQFTVRPYRQGYGCDGTTDTNIHLIALELCDRLGIDYVDAYVAAYPEDTTFDDCQRWTSELRDDMKIRAETLIPADSSPAVVGLMLNDLYQINNRSLVAELEERLEAAGIRYIRPGY